MSDRSTREPSSLLGRHIPCRICGNEFWQQLSKDSRDECDDCYHNPRALVRRDVTSLSRKATTLEDDEDFLERLKDLLMRASRPVAFKELGFLDHLFGHDPNVSERQQREIWRQQAKDLMDARHAFLKLARDESETRRGILQRQIEAKLDVMRAEVERLRQHKAAEQVQSEIEQIAAERYIRRLDEAMKVKKLLERAQGGDQRPTASNAEIEKVRRQFGAKAEAEQAVIDDFRAKVMDIYCSDGSDQEKALRIRSVVSVYGLGRDALPNGARRLLERVDEE